jgi:rhodanese-related sulfurtransferase
MPMIAKPDTQGALNFFQNKVAYTTGPVELSYLIKEGQGYDRDFTVVDVRDAEDFAKAHIPGAINLPRDRWSSPEGLSADKPNILYCYTQQCHLAAKAGAQFAKKGFPVMEMEGGFRAWQDAGLPTEK